VAVLPAAFATTPARATDRGIRVLSSQQLDSRLTELTLSTPALRKPTHVRVQGPAAKATLGELPIHRSWTGEMPLPYELADQPVSLLNAEDA